MTSLYGNDCCTKVDLTIATAEATQVSFKRLYTEVEPSIGHLASRFSQIFPPLSWKWKKLAKLTLSRHVDPGKVNTHECVKSLSKKVRFSYLLQEHVHFVTFWDTVYIISKCVSCPRIDPIRFLAGWRRRQLKPGLSCSFRIFCQC